MQLKGITAASFGLISVMAGALGAHYLKDRLPPESLKSFDTAVRFLFFHAITLLILSVWSQTQSEKTLNRAFSFMVAGVALFSGSIFILVIGKMAHSESLRFFGPVTPIGGILLMIGWCFLIAYFAKGKNHVA